MVRKGKFVVIQAIIFYRGSGGIAPIVPTLSSKWSAAHSGHTLGKQLLVPIELEAGWAAELL
jgi:hypothetical protein